MKPLWHQGETLEGNYELQVNSKPQAVRTAAGLSELTAEAGKALVELLDDNTDGFITIHDPTQRRRVQIRVRYDVAVKPVLTPHQTMFFTRLLEDSLDKEIGLPGWDNLTLAVALDQIELGEPIEDLTDSLDIIGLDTEPAIRAFYRSIEGLRNQYGDLVRLYDLLPDDVVDGLRPE